MFHSIQILEPNWIEIRHVLSSRTTLIIMLKNWKDDDQMCLLYKDIIRLLNLPLIKKDIEQKPDIEILTYILPFLKFILKFVNIIEPT
jgi:hypothetical protein